ncbi:MAG: DUF885 domain-containing protein [Planctomycetes bacterium]|nr:DUF885 domain-containing protein [Planctomycetota bacterium]
MSNLAARFPLRSLLLPAVLAFAACEAIRPLLPTPVEELDLWADAAAGVTDAALADLCADVWQAELRADPFRATYLGDPRWHGKVPDTSLEGRLARKARLGGFRERLRVLELRELLGADALTAELLRAELENGLLQNELALEEWTVDPLEGPHVRILNLANVQPYASERERDQLVERWEALAGFVRQAGRNLERGRSGGRVASRTAVEKVIRQLDAVLAQPPHLSPLVSVAAGGGRWIEFPNGGNLAALAHEHLGDAREQGVLLDLNRHLLEPERTVNGTHVLLPTAGDALDLTARAEFLYDVLRAVEQDIYPALAGYRDVLANKILPAAREDDRPGLKYLAGGAGLYKQLIHAHTSLPMDECDAKAIHEYGLEEVRRVRVEIAQLGSQLFGTRDVAAVQAKLRNDPEVHFKTRAEVAAKAVEALARARGQLRGFFGLVPESACEVLPIPEFEEQDSTIAYYREPAADGSRPGRYFVNTYAPETRPRYEAEVLAFHEAIPGHHLQIAIAQERAELPRFRRHSGSTAFVEGWALYSERLCDEMGLYSGDLDRMGVLSYDAWRAARLVVDTGLHFFGWSRDEAIEYLLDNTLLAANNVENEVDRYIAWPGQALAYKLGQREILALREQARTALGAGFRYPEFHDRVLENGAVTLPALRGVIERWIGSRGRAPVEASSGR